MRKGTINFYNDEKAYGFIRSEGEEIFFHLTKVEDKIESSDKGRTVQFQVVEGKKGKEADKVKFI